MFGKLAIILTVVFIFQSVSLSVSAKKLTITQRQNILMEKITRAVSAGELTAKEAGSLRNEEAKIVAKETRMKNKNGGRLSYKNMTELEKNLNHLSNRLHKKELAKRVD